MFAKALFDILKKSSKTVKEINVSMKHDRRGYAALYNFSYMSIGAFAPLVGQYLSSEGFSGTQVGTVTATGTAVAIFASAFWGKRYSRSGRKDLVLMGLCLMASLMCFVFMNMEEYIFVIAAFGAMYFFQAPVMSLTDAFTVERASGFGSLRAWGAVGFALGIFLAGVFSDVLDIKVIFPFYILSFTAAAVTVWRIGVKTEEKERGNVKGDSVKREGGYTSLLKNRRLCQLILCAFFMGGTNVANNTYFSFLYIEGGGTVAGVGAVMLLMVGSEVPFMAWCERLSRKFTGEKTIMAAMIISAVRFLVMGLGLPWWMLAAISFSQGAVNGIILIEFVRYAAKLAPKGKESLAISAYYIIGSNLSTIVCQLCGGRLLDLGGAAAVYLFFGFFNMAGVCLYWKFKLYKSIDETGG